MPFPTSDTPHASMSTPAGTTGVVAFACRYVADAPNCARSVQYPQPADVCVNSVMEFWVAVDVYHTDRS